jgi:hypothetical protein
LPDSPALHVIRDQRFGKKRSYHPHTDISQPDVELLRLGDRAVVLVLAVDQERRGVFACAT